MNAEHAVQPSDGAPAVALRTRRFAFDGSPAHADELIERVVPVETPVNVIYGATPFAVMMATPGDLIDFAYGFSLTEGIIAHAAQLRQVDVEPQRDGVALHITLAPGVDPHALRRERNTVARTGCGLCGIDTIDAIPFTAQRAHTRHQVRLSVVQMALNKLEARQTLNHQTHAVHGAAWFTGAGACVALREDVGRHNALDKLIGALIRDGHEAADGLLVITSRCSFEMVEKAAAFGASTLIAISAPTSLAVERAALHNMTLLAIARRDSALVFHGAEYVVDDITLGGRVPVTGVSA